MNATNKSKDRAMKFIVKLLAEIEEARPSDAASNDWIQPSRIAGAIPANRISPGESRGESLL